MSSERLDAFLTDLTELSLKHGLVVLGCGCDGSPYIEPLQSHPEKQNRSNVPEVAEFLKWELGGYTARPSKGLAGLPPLAGSGTATATPTGDK